MDKTFFCIDNFYKDPDQIRQDVLSGNGFTWFPHNTSYSYPNGNAPFLGKMTKERYVPNRRLDLVVSGFAGENVAPMMRLDHGCFRLAKPEDSTSMFSHNIHADSMTIKKNDWAGVLYLTPVKEEIEGTIFLQKHCSK